MTKERDVLPEQIGSYIRKERIVTDHLGTLYQSIDQQTNQPVWLKHFDVPETKDPALLQRFVEGIQYLQQFQHPKIIQVRDVINDPQYGACVIIEQSDGQSLNKIFEEKKYIPSEKFSYLMNQLLEGIKALHQSSLIHGDLRSSNIFISQVRDNVPDLKILHTGHGWWWSELLRLNGGFSDDSKFYLSPEQLAGNTWDHRVDIYACGVIFVEFLLGMPIYSQTAKIFWNSNHKLMIDKILSHLDSSYDQSLAREVLIGALAEDPSQRFSSAHDFEIVILKFLESSSNKALSNALVEANASGFLPTEQHLNGLGPMERTTVGPTEKNLGSQDSLDAISEGQDLLDEYDDDWGASGSLDFGEATTIQPMPDVDFDASEAPQSTERMELSDALQSINYQGYIKTQEEEALLAAIQADNDEKTRPGFTPLVGKLPSLDAGLTPTNDAGRGLGVGKDPFESTYIGPGDIARGAAVSEESSPKTWLIWVSIPLFLFVVLIFVFYGTSSIKMVDKQPPPRKVFVSMTLNTQPQGSNIRVNGEFIKKTTPLTIRARIGTKLLIQIFKKDYKSITFQWLAIKTDQRQFSLELTKPIQPKVVARITPKKVSHHKTRRRTPPSRRREYKPRFPMAVLSIYTLPPKAKVLIGGHRWPGQTPLKVRLRKGEEVQVTIRKYGHHDAFFRWKAEQNETKKIHLYRLSWYNP